MAKPIKLILSPTSDETILDQHPGLGVLIGPSPTKGEYQHVMGLKSDEAGQWILPDLPYSYEALEPYIDTQTMRLHHDMHHKAYVTKLNAALLKLKDVGMPAWKDDPFRIVQRFEELPIDLRKTVRDNGGGYINHQLFWLQMTPHEKATAKRPSAALSDAISQCFGSFDTFREKFSGEAEKIFGSGWAWLTVDQHKKLRICATPNQDTPIMVGSLPILGLDVWEHAYYLKYNNRRPEYIRNWWNVVDWEFVSQLFAIATA